MLSPFAPNFLHIQFPFSFRPLYPFIRLLNCQAPLTNPLFFYQEISDRLMEHMIIKTTRRPMSAFKAAQQPSIVSYFLPSDLTARDPACVHIEERRNLLAARGTTGLRVWDACSHLAYYLSSPSSSGATKTTNLIADKNVLELGAGTGLLSILCAGPLRARRVISTDGDGDVVETIRANAALNNSGAPPHHNSAVATTNLVAKVLDWTDEASLPDVLRHNDDNGNGNGDGRIPLDVILGADITYATESLVPLVHILGALEDLYPRVCIIISTVIRNEATYASFVATCAEARFAVATVPFACPPLEEQTGFFHKTTPPIRIVRLTREGENAV